MKLLSSILIILHISNSYGQFTNKTPEEFGPFSSTNISYKVRSTTLFVETYDSAKKIVFNTGATDSIMKVMDFSTSITDYSIGTSSYLIHHHKHQYIVLGDSLTEIQVNLKDSTIFECPTDRSEIEPGKLFRSSLEAAQLKLIDSSDVEYRYEIPSGFLIYNKINNEMFVFTISSIDNEVYVVMVSKYFNLEKVPDPRLNNIYNEYFAGDQKKGKLKLKYSKFAYQMCE